MKSFADWLIRYVPPPVKKVVNEKWESEKSTVLGLFSLQKKFEIRKRNTAIRVRQRTIHLLHLGPFAYTS